MHNPQSDPEPERALITLTPRALMPAQRWLPTPIARRAAVITVVGAAGAVGTFFLKRLGELIAEDLYRRVRRQPASSPTPTADASAPPPDAVHVRLVSLQRVMHGPHYQQHLRIRQGWLRPAEHDSDDQA